MKPWDDKLLCPDALNMILQFSRGATNSEILESNLNSQDHHKFLTTQNSWASTCLNSIAYSGYKLKLLRHKFSCITHNAKKKKLRA